MKRILLLLLLCNVVYANDCDVDPLSLSALDHPKCLNETTTKKDLKIVLISPLDARQFCEKCKDPLMDKLVLTSNEKKEIRKEKSNFYGQAVLNEFQKEMTFLSLDLLKIRSSYTLDFNPKKSISSCDFEKKLKMPKCLDSKQEEEFNKQVAVIKNSLASELASIISGGTKKSDGLFVRKDKVCGISDSDIIFSYMRYTEDLLTPEMIKKIDQFNIPPGTDIDTYLKENPDLPKSIFGELKRHPILNVMLRDTTQLKNFLKDVSNDNHETIIKKLYSKKHSKSLGDNISSRCESAFSKTSKYLDDIYCKDKPSYVADEFSSMEMLSGESFKRMDDSKAEKEIRRHCANLNAKQKDFLSFSTISFDINKNNEPIISKAPIKDFKKHSYSDSFSNYEELMCKAKTNNTCKAEPNRPECKMLHYLELSKSSKEYKEMAKASSDNVNLILRSLVGSGQPMSEGKPDYKAVTLLKNEGILPGGSPTSHPVQKDVSTFQKETRIAQSNSTQKTKALTPQTQAAKSPASTQQDFAPAQIENPTNGQDKSTHAAAAAPTHKAIDPKAFSKLSDKEQNEILKRLKSGKKGSPIKAANIANNTTDLPEGTSELTNSFTASRSDQSNDSQTKPKPTIANHSKANHGKDVKLDPAKKESSSYNKALNEANNHSSAVELGQGSISTSNSSDSSAAKSKDQSKQGNLEVTTTDKEVIKVHEFQAKLQEYLKAQKHDLKVSKVGESFLVKIKNIEIKVLFNETKNAFEAVCDNAKVPKPFLQKISTYFNHTLSRGKGKLHALKTELKQARR